MSRWRASALRSRAAGIMADPYYEWARATRFAYYGEARWVPVLLRLRKITAHKFAQQVIRMQNSKKGRRGWAAQLRIPAFYAERPRRLARAPRFIGVLATRGLLERVYRGQAPSESIQSFELSRSVTPSGPEYSQSAAFQAGQQQAPKVVSGVIDDGIAFAHERFLGVDGWARIEYFWDQLVPSLDWGELNYGRQIDKRDPAEGIDRLIADSRHGALVDEDELYRRSGHVDQSQRGHKPLAQRAAHGAHVLDLASGANPRPPAGHWPIIAVQLPTATTADTSGATLAQQIYNGLVYIVDRAEAIAKSAGKGELPIVVNVSYGLIAGPHDGSSRLEEAIDELLGSCKVPLRVVLPAGNNYLSRCHAHISLAAGAAEELRWRVLPDDWTETHMEIRLPDVDDNGDPPDLCFTITAPDGDVSTAFCVGEERDFEVHGNRVGQASFYPPGEAGRCALMRLSLAPTGRPEAGLPLAPAGLWRIKIDNARGKARVRDIHAWIQRDDTPLGYPRRGRQSYFDDPAYGRYDDGGREIGSDSHVASARSHVKRRGTVNAIATGSEPIVVGGIRRSDWKPASYTASGPVTHHPPGRGEDTPQGPDALTVSDDTPSHRGVVAAGSRSGSAVAMYGTSVAAPQVARWVAQELAAGRKGDRRALAKYTDKVVLPPLYTEKRRPPGAAAKPNAERGGAGRVEFPPRRARFDR